ncbi:glycosyltransferase family 4 protein [Candidatus Poribacteria bacterium]|nr:glycosyltransferase family 4 protein [Candidatus Poribacteria bacterium]
MKAKILWMSDSPTTFTGFATVTKELLGRLARLDKYHIACIGWGYDGWPYDRSLFPYDIYPSAIGQFGRDVLPRVIRDFQPDILITLADLWMISWIPNMPERQSVQYWGYIPIDGEPLHPSWNRIIKDMDVVITCSKYGQQLVERTIPSVKVEMIYHGVDTEVFKPLTDKESLRKRYGLENQFIVGCVARNQPRKQLPILIKAFARFCQDKDDALLYLHTDPNDVGWDILDLLRRYGLDDKSCITKDATVLRGVSKQQLNEIYNLFDVMVLPSAGEGFGLPIIEAMAAGVPVIATGYSACVELVEGRGGLIKVKEFLTLGRHNIEQAIADVDDLVDKLNLLYDNADLREQYSRRGLEFAQTLDWNRIVEKWNALLASRIIAKKSLFSS